MAEKTYDTLSAQLDRLIKERDAMKEKKMTIIVDAFKHAFDNEMFLEKVLKIKNSDMKTIASYMVRNFDSISEQALLEKERKRSSK